MRALSSRITCLEDQADVFGMAPDVGFYACWLAAERGWPGWLLQALATCFLAV
jgi:hypothetical protein